MNADPSTSPDEPDNERILAMVIPDPLSAESEHRGKDNPSQHPDTQLWKELTIFTKPEKGRSQSHPTSSSTLLGGKKEKNIYILSSS